MLKKNLLESVKRIVEFAQSAVTRTMKKEQVCCTKPGGLVFVTVCVCFSHHTYLPHPYTQPHTQIHNCVILSETVSKECGGDCILICKKCIQNITFKFTKTVRLIQECNYNSDTQVNVLYVQ